MLCEGEKLTKELPVLFEAAGIPAPTLDDGQPMMDNRLQLRLFLDTTIPRLRHAIQVYRKKNTGVEEEEEDEEEEKEEDKEEDKNEGKEGEQADLSHRLYTIRFVVGVRAMIRAMMMMRTMIKIMIMKSMRSISAKFFLIAM